MIFKPEMFEEVLEVKADHKWLMKYVAKTANVLLREHLLTATVVYCDKDELHFSGVDKIGYTHKGYLIGVKEIEKEPCKHEPLRRSLGIEKNDYEYKAFCKHCGVELQATWSEKK